MTATIKEFCRINGIDEASADLADIIYNALKGDSGRAVGCREVHGHGARLRTRLHTQRHCRRGNAARTKFAGHP